MKAVHIAPRGKIDLPRWRPQSHLALQHILRTWRMPAGLVVLALTVALASFGASVALAPSRSLTFDPVALAATRADWRLLDSQVQEFKASRGAVAPIALTFDPVAIAATRADWRLLDSQVQEFKASRGAVAPLPMVDPVPTVTPQPGTWYVGKPLPN